MAIVALLHSHIYAAIGHAFGHAIAREVGVAAHYEALARLVILLLGIVVFSVHRWRCGRAPTTQSQQP